VLDQHDDAGQQAEYPDQVVSASDGAVQVSYSFKPVVQADVLRGMLLSGGGGNCTRGYCPQHCLTDIQCVKGELSLRISDI
jgi:hypothetical protein